MATADELLARLLDIEDVLVVDANLRTIKIPTSITNLGVVSDDKVLKVRFQMPREYCGIDLSTFRIRVNYLNANDEGDVYDVEDAVKLDDTITFSWLVGRHAASVQGDVEFSLCLVDTDANGKVNREFNTTPTSLPIFAGLETGAQVVQAHADILEQWRAKLFGFGDTEEARIYAVSQEQQQTISEQREAVLNDITLKGSETLATIPDDYIEVYNMADEAIRTKADAIVLESEGSVIAVNDASDDYVLNLKLYGKTTQAGDELPSPDNPQELASVEKSTTTVCGKNLARTKGTKNVVHEGLTIDFKPGVSEISLDGTTAMAFGYGIAEGIYLTPGIYTMSVYGLNSFGAKYDQAYLLNTDTRETVCNEVQSGSPKTFTIAEAGNYRVDFLFKAASVYDNATIKFQIEVGSFATDYEPYIEPQSIALNRTLSGIPVSSGGNYTDENGQQWICDEVDFERGVYIQRIGVIEFDGSADEDWGGVSAPTENMRSWITVADAYRSESDTGVGIMCSQFSPNVSMETGAFYQNRDRFFFGSGMTLTEWRSHLQTESLELAYILATPIETPLTSEETLAYRALKTNKPNTTVVNDQNTHMVLSYSADTLKFLRDNQPGPTDDQVKSAVNSYLDDHIESLISEYMAKLANETR